MKLVEKVGRKLARILVGGDRAAEVVGGEQQSVDLESGIRAARLDKALEEEAGNHEHEQCEPALQRHQAIANRASTRGLRSASKRLLRIDSSKLQCRRGAEQQAAADAEDHREDEPHRIEAGLKADRERAVRRHRSQGFGAPPRDHDANKRRRARPSRRFSASIKRMTLPGPAPSASRTPTSRWRELARASDKVRGVAAHGEQHQQHHALQDAERGDEHHLRAARRPPVRHQLAADAAVALREMSWPAHSWPTTNSPVARPSSAPSRRRPIAE